MSAPEIFDVVVIGAGVAGASAALAAAARGVRTLAIDGGTGASTLSSGALDLEPWRAAVPTRGPADTRETLDRFAPVAAFDHLILAPCKLATTAGLVRPAAGRDRALLDLGACTGGPIGVPRADHAGWDADLFLKSWRASAFRRTVDGTVESSWFVVLDTTLLRFTDERDMPDADLASRHDDPARLAWLAERLREGMARAADLESFYRSEDGFLHYADKLGGILLPPWLGIEAPRAEALSAMVGVPCGEAVSGVGGPSGLRFERARSRAFAAKSIAVMTGRVSRIAAAGDDHDVYLDNGTKVHARSVVIATGGLIGGGIAYTPSASALGGPMPKAAQPSFVATIDADVEIGVNGRRIDQPGSLFGAAPEDLAWPTARFPILDRVGIRETSAGIFVAGDVAADVDSTWLGAARSGQMAGHEAAERAKLHPSERG